MIKFTNIGESAYPDLNDSSDTAVYVSGSWTPPTNGVIIACVAGFSLGKGGSDAVTLAGNGLTWTQIGSRVERGHHGLTLFLASAAGSSVGVTTATFAAAQGGCFIAFCHVTGVKLVTDVSDCWAQHVTGSHFYGSSGTVTLAAASDSRNAVFACFCHSVFEYNSAGAGWSELDNNIGSLLSRSIITEYRDDVTDLSPSASWATTSGWFGFAVELVAADPHDRERGIGRGVLAGAGRGV